MSFTQKRFTILQLHFPSLFAMIVCSDYANFMTFTILMYIWQALKYEVRFLPRDAYVHKRGICCRPLSVSLSVCPSVTFVYCIQTATNIVKLISGPDSAITQLQGKPLHRGRKMHMSVKSF